MQIDKNTHELVYDLFYFSLGESSTRLCFQVCMEGVTIDELHYEEDGVSALNRLEQFHDGGVVQTG